MFSTECSYLDEQNKFEPNCAVRRCRTKINQAYLYRHMQGPANGCSKIQGLYLLPLQLLGQVL